MRLFIFFSTCVAILAALIAQTCIIGLNGLTILTIPMTIFLGLEILEKIIPEQEEKQSINN